MSRSYRSSKPDHWTVPRAPQDASRRFQVHGKIVPLEEGWIRSEMKDAVWALPLLGLFLVGLWIITP